VTCTNILGFPTCGDCPVGFAGDGTSCTRVLWSTSYANGVSDVAIGAVEQPDGKALVIANSSASGGADRRMWTFVIDPVDGAIIVQKLGPTSILTTVNDFAAERVRQRGDGAAMVAGTAIDTSVAKRVGFVATVSADAAGATILAHPTQAECGDGIRIHDAIDLDGSDMLVGGSVCLDNVNDGHRLLYLARYQMDGVVRWRRIMNLGATSGFQDDAFVLALLSGGSVAVGGSADHTKPWFLRIDPSTAVAAVDSLPTNRLFQAGAGEAHGAVAAGTDTILVGSSDANDVFIRRVHPNGTALWAKTFATATTDRLNDVTLLGNVAIAVGQTGDPSDALVVGLDATTGATLFRSRYGGSGNDVARFVLPMSEGRVLVGGAFNAAAADGSGGEAWVFMLEPDGDAPLKTDLVQALVDDGDAGAADTHLPNETSGFLPPVSMSIGLSAGSGFETSRGTFP
jgi:hypothetical protein